MQLKAAAPQKSRKTEQAEATRAAILAVARELFAEMGYANAGTEEVVKRARITRGALYHHFRDKQALFCGVYEVVLSDLYARIVKAAKRGRGIWESYRLGREAFLDSCTDRSVCRIVLIDAPSVLGWTRMYEIQNRMGTVFQEKGLLRATIQEAMDAGEIERQPAEPLAAILQGAFDAAALEIAHAQNRAQTRREVGAALNWLIERLRTRKSRSRRAVPVVGKGGSSEVGTPSKVRRLDARHLPPTT
jgi:AcrR family transcriptional regulator